MMMKTVGYGETHTSTPDTTVSVSEVSSVLERPHLKANQRETGKSAVFDEIFTLTGQNVPFQRQWASRQNGMQPTGPEKE